MASDGVWGTFVMVSGGEAEIVLVIECDSVIFVKESDGGWEIFVMVGDGRGVIE